MISNKFLTLFLIGLILVIHTQIVASERYSVTKDDFPAVDQLLNDNYEDLKNEITFTDFEALRASQRAWIPFRDAEAKRMALLAGYIEDINRYKAILTLQRIEELFSTDSMVGMSPYLSKDSPSELTKNSSSEQSPLPENPSIINNDSSTHAVAQQNATPPTSEDENEQSSPKETLISLEVEGLANNGIHLIAYKKTGFTGGGLMKVIILYNNTKRYVKAMKINIIYVDDFGDTRIVENIQYDSNSRWVINDEDARNQLIPPFSFVSFGSMFDGSRESYAWAIVDSSTNESRKKLIELSESSELESYRFRVEKVVFIDKNN